MSSRRVLRRRIAAFVRTLAVAAALVVGLSSGTVFAQPTPTNTPTDTATPTDTNTPTNTPTDTATPTDTNTPTDTPTDTATPTDTNTPTNTVTDVPGCSPVASPSTLPDGAINVPYSQLLTGSGGTPPYVFSVIVGSLPPGLTLSAAGQISGTPTAIGSFDFTVRITDSAIVPCVTEQPYNIEILAAIRTTPPSFLLLLAVMLALTAWMALRRRPAER
jgi:hypothetical protein